MAMRPLAAAILAFALTMLAISCSDGKLNVLLLSYGEQEDPPEYVPGPGEPLPSSSSFTIPVISSSSVAAVAVVSSSSEEKPSSSSSILNQPPGYSSSNRGVRSSTSTKVNKNGEKYIDYETLIEGMPNVKKGWASRYWDGCKPHCSRTEHVENTQPWALCKNCDKNNNEMPAYYLHPDASSYWPGTYLGTPSGCDAHDMDLWQRSPAYQDWISTNPAYPPNSPAYTCWDQAPHVINDTLAYAFAATSMEESHCGKCFVLQFDGGNNFDIPRDAHRAIKGKTLVVLSSNVGGDVAAGQFDVMIPGGGLGAFTTGLPSQINVPADDLGEVMGGLLSTCIHSGDYYKTPMETLQTCVRERCRKVFGTKAKELLDGCLFMADWYMSADNPTHVYKEVECPQYLVDKYISKIHTEKPAPLW
jgi:hypothetical protein